MSGYQSAILFAVYLTFVPVYFEIIRYNCQQNLKAAGREELWVHCCTGYSQFVVLMPTTNGKGTRFPTRAQDLAEIVCRLFSRFPRLDPAVAANVADRIVDSLIRGEGTNIQNIAGIAYYRVKRELMRQEAKRREHEVLVEPSLLTDLAGADPNSLTFVEEMERESFARAVKDRMDPETRRIHSRVALGRSLAAVARELGQPETTLARHYRQGLQRAMERLKHDTETAKSLR